MEAQPITQAEYELLAAKAWFNVGYGWVLPDSTVMGELECGTSKARRIKSIVLARLSREFPHGRPKTVNAEPVKDVPNGVGVVGPSE